MTAGPSQHAPLVAPDTAARITKVIELMRPAIQADGGDVKFVEARADGSVYIRFLGACVGCPSSEITLHMGIERNLLQHVPEVKRVIVLE
jgi:Fe-S cluster biogenesis protein NfuA